MSTDTLAATLAPPPIPKVVFRDYDIRGLADSEITPQFALQLGRALGTLMIKNDPVVYVGRDARLSSGDLADALIQGLVACGCKVINLGEVTTPVLNFAVHHLGENQFASSGNGVMVTASHNPKTYNGFKIIHGRQVIAGETLQQLIPMMRDGEFLTGRGSVETVNIVPQYIQHIVDNSRVTQSFKLVIDGANSVPGPIANQLFERLGCLTFPLYCNIDGSFPNHPPNPADENNLVDLRHQVAETQSDLGLAFDGDGDRVVVISARGRIVWPDQLMMIFARDVLARQPGADIVFDVKSSKRLAEIIRLHSGNPLMCKTGHAHVRKAVHDNNAPLGGEFSGHIFFNDRWRGFDDGAYAAVRLLEVLCDLGQTLDEVIDELESTVSTAEILLPIDESEKFQLMKTLQAGCRFAHAEVITVDGLRVEYPSGWGLVRASNTSPNLTLRFEADDERAMSQVKAAFCKELEPFIHNIKEYI